jgi:hypothetical protein
LQTGRNEFNCLLGVYRLLHGFRRRIPKAAMLENLHTLCFLRYNIYTSSGLHSTLHLMMPWAKRLKHESRHSSLLTVGVYKEWSFTSVLPIRLLGAVI